MARRAICRVGAGGSVSVQSRDYGRTFGPGSECDLDEVVLAASGQPGTESYRPAQTLADALGKRLELFEVVETPRRRAPVTDAGA